MIGTFPFFYLLFLRVHEDNRHLLLSSPILSSVGLWHAAAQSRLCVRDAALLQSLRGPGVAEVRLSKDSRGETPATNVNDPYLGWAIMIKSFIMVILKYIVM